MCSTAVGGSGGSSPRVDAAQRIAEIGRAIDDLAVKAGPGAKAEAGAGAGAAGHLGPAADAEAATSDTDPIVARLAELWALLAELDPEVARRLAGYQNLSALTDLWPAYPRQRAFCGLAI
jgi:hypothetical protein